MKDDGIRDEPIDPHTTDILQAEVRGDAQYDPEKDPNTKGPLEKAKGKLSDLLGGTDEPQQGVLSDDRE